MLIDHRDVCEALFQAPGDQLVALSATIARFRETLKQRASADAECLCDLDGELELFSDRATAIMAVVEKLQEFAEHAHFIKRRPRNTKERQGTTPFTTAVRPTYAKELLRQLAEAREVDDARKAARVREVAMLYCLEDLAPAVRETLLAGLRADALAYGDTPNGCCGDLKALLREELGADAL